MTSKCSAMVFYLHCGLLSLIRILLLLRSVSSVSIVTLLLQRSWAFILSIYYYKVTRERKFININAILWGKGVPIFI